MNSQVYVFLPAFVLLCLFKVSHVYQCLSEGDRKLKFDYNFVTLGCDHSY